MNTGIVRRLLPLAAMFWVLPVAQGDELKASPLITAPATLSSPTLISALGTRQIMDFSAQLATKRLPAGTTLVCTTKTGSQVLVTASGGKIVDFLVKDKLGKELPTTLTKTKDNLATTCWECWYDSNGEKQCFKVGCPD
jgi:hypothetical protein